MRAGTATRARVTKGVRRRGRKVKKRDDAKRNQPGPNRVVVNPFHLGGNQLNSPTDVLVNEIVPKVREKPRLKWEPRDRRLTYWDTATRLPPILIAA